MKKHHLEETTITSKSIYKGRIISLQVDEVNLPNGKTSTREIIKHPGAVAVIPVTDEGKIIMVEQYRKAMEKALVEIPAGKLEKGEDPLETAKRELEEETGLQAGQMKKVISFYTSPGFADELVYVYLATELTTPEKPLEVDEDEFVEVLELSIEEAKKLVEEERIHDAKTAYAVQYLELAQLKQK